jgi:glycolate oxidase
LKNCNGYVEKNVVSADDRALQKYAHDQVPEDKYARFPEVAVLPKTELEISASMKLANREKIPVTPRAAGSGLSGGAVPIYGGILLSVERMNPILERDKLDWEIYFRESGGIFRARW